MRRIVQALKRETTFFYKEQRTDHFYTVDHVGYEGELLFSPDGEKIYNLFRDYPKKFTDEEKDAFDQENPFWAGFFKDRS